MDAEAERCPECWAEAQQAQSSTETEEMYKRFVQYNLCGNHPTSAEFLVSNVVVNIVTPPVADPQFVDLAHPCVQGRHRWAYLVSGEVACGYCGMAR